jgi:hypothetical protein
MSVQRNGILLSDNGELVVSGIAAVPTTAIPTKGDANLPVFGKFLDATGAVYVRFV